MHDKNLISRLLNYKGAVFFMIKNAEGKCWLLPERNLYTAMNIYQPSTIKGKILKSFFPFFSKYQAVRKLLDIKTYKLELNKLLEKKLKSLFDFEDLEFSIFGGTPSSHQKITMQIYKGSKILGYCKFSDKKEISILFKQEEQTLDFLKKQGVDQIPICLFSGNYQEDIDFFVQTTKKTNTSIQSNKWSISHEDFLYQLHNKTKQNILFEKSDFYNSLRLLKINLGLLKKQHSHLIINSIKFLENFFKTKEVNFSVYHGDFTPWNMIIESKKLFVFDFEYAKKTFPPFLDRYHFYTQVCIHEKKWNAEEIFYNYLNKNDVIFKNTKNSILFMSYLLSIISLYLDREKLNFYNFKEASIWIELLNLINEKK
jgi:hypothetical protein